MILRKPYAFFIKYFRLIHVILAILLFYEVYNTKTILDFFNEYAANNINLTGQNLIEIYLTTFFQFAPILIIGILILIVTILFIKKKPVTLYLINVACYIYTFIINIVIRSTLKTMQMDVIDVRASRLVRDLVLISFVIQIVCSIIITIRAVGFDIKKFNFGQDLKDLDISEEDREEFELELNYDKDKTKRELRQKIRYLKYAYKENKLFVLIVAIVLLFILVPVSLIFIFKQDKVYSENQYFVQNNLSMKINESYITDKDYKGNIIDSESLFVILKVSIKNNSNKENILDTATAKLLVGEYSYIPTTDYKDYFIDFGKTYLNGDIPSEYISTTLIYKIPKQFENEEVYFKFVNKVNLKSSLVKLNIKKLTDEKIYTYNIGQELSINDTIKGYKVYINSFDIQKKYRIDYDFYIYDERIPSIQYITPTISGNTNKALLKLEYKFSRENTDIEVYSLFDLISKFAKIKYIINGTEKVNNVTFKQINSKNSGNNIYIEVNEELISAEKIVIEFTLRNIKYQYILK